MDENYKNKSINEIKGLSESKPEFGSSLEKNILKAEKKLIKSLTNEELRMFLGQNMHLELIVPETLDRLRIDILSRSEDMDILLLARLLKIDLSYWDNNSQIKNDLVNLIKDNMQNLEDPKTLDKTDLEIYKQQELPELRILIADFNRQ